MGTDGDVDRPPGLRAAGAVRRCRGGDQGSGREREAGAHGDRVDRADQRSRQPERTDRRFQQGHPRSGDLRSHVDDRAVRGCLRRHHDDRHAGQLGEPPRGIALLRYRRVADHGALHPLAPRSHRERRVGLGEHLHRYRPRRPRRHHGVRARGARRSDRIVARYPRAARRRHPVDDARPRIRSRTRNQRGGQGADGAGGSTASR